MPDWDRLFTLTSAGIDHAVLRVLMRLWLTGGDPESEPARRREDRAFEVYAGEALRREPLAFFPRPGPAPIEVTRARAIPEGRHERYRWASGYRTYDTAYQADWDLYAENRTAHAECFRHDRGGAPTIVCIHSWATNPAIVHRWAFLVRDLYRAGFDVSIFTLPFHGPRTPRGSWFGGQLFPGTCPQRTNEGFGQTVWDSRALIEYLRQRGSPAVGAIGMSMGGYTTALLASLDPELAFGIPMIPMASLADLLWSHGEGQSLRRKIEARGVTLERIRELYRVHCPLAMSPLISPERLMIIAGHGDRVCPPDHVRLLWEHWNRPDIHWFPGSHLAHFGRSAVLERLLAFFARLGLSSSSPAGRRAFAFGST